MYGAQTDSPLRGDYAQARADFTVDLPSSDYAETAHELWRRLYARQSRLVGRYACREFLEGLERTACASRIPDLRAISEDLQRASGWQLVAVPGFIPDEQFFRHLAARRFPVTVWLRKPEEFDYLVEPDIFHDFFGHVPMLFNRRFGDFMQRFGAQGLRAIQAGALARVARLYWYTVEFGLIDTVDGLRAYGAGILSSGGETPYAVDAAEPVRVRFDLHRCMRTAYRIDAFQRTYFVNRSFDELLDAVSGDLSASIEAVHGAPDLQPGLLYAGDQAIAVPSPHAVSPA